MTLKEKKIKQKQRVLQIVDVDDIKTHMKTQKYRETLTYFSEKYDCSKNIIDEIIDELNLHKSVEDSQAMRIATNMRKYGAGTKPRKPIIDRDLLYKYYIEEFLPIEEVIKKFDNKYTRTQITNALHDYNIRRDKKSNPNYKWDDELKKKHEESFIKKYGFSSPMKNPDVINKGKQTCIDRYGEDYWDKWHEKLQTAYTEKTGFENPFQDVENIRNSMLEKYGVEYSSQLSSVIEKSKQTKLDRYGNSGYNNIDKIRQTNLEKYGVEFASKLPQIQEKIRQTNLDRYGVECTLCLPQANNIKRVHTIPNERFFKLLEDIGLKYEKDFFREFPLMRKQYDFRIGKYLIEINPTISHNSTFNPWSNKGIDMYYHQQKSMLATENGYRCIHIFDWNDAKLIVNNILNNVYTIDVTYAKPNPHYVNIKTNTLCDKDDENCVVVYDDGAVE